MKQRLRDILRSLVMRINLPRTIALGFQSKYPQRQLIMGYLGYTVIGTLALMLPFSTHHPVAFIDHLFNAVSAISTTGLATVDVSSDYTFWGQLIILLLIQLGGLGYMTLTSFIMLKVTHHLGGLHRNVFSSQYSFPSDMPDRSMMRHILRFMFFFEGLGILLLYPYFLIAHQEQPLWSAVFHTVSAFCTAGFSIYPDNLMRFECDYYVNIVIMLLSYMGAMGYIMMTDLARKLIRKGHRIIFTTKVIVTITCALSLWSTVHLFFFEPLLQHYSVGDRFLVALFQSMSAMTTVGYNTIDVGLITQISLLVLSVSMYIGASPSGTGGGLKSTTLSAIYAYTKNKLGMRKEVSLCGNIIPAYRIETALTTFIFYTFILLAGIYLIALFEPADTDFLQIIFEASSALATAGLSCGMLNSATVGSKVILILLMFIGRIGVVTLGNVLLARALDRKKPKEGDLVV